MFQKLQHRQNRYWKDTFLSQMMIDILKYDVIIFWLNYHLNANRIKNWNTLNMFI
jgi:hypothetical protein